MKKVFLDDLPKEENGNIRWNELVGKRLKFKYGRIEDYVSVDRLDSKHLYVSCADVTNFKIKKCHFKNLQLGKLLERHDGNFALEIGSHLLSEKRDLLIIDKEYRVGRTKNNVKWYKYKCNRCGYDEGWITEHNLIGSKKTNPQGCSCCHGVTVVLGINTIWDTDRWMCDLGVSEEDAKKYTRRSNADIHVKCPDCGNVRRVNINNIYVRKSIKCECSTDGFSYPEKFMTNILMQLGVDFETQYSPDYLDNRRSDFYLPKYKMVIETDGSLGHEGGTVHGCSDKVLDDLVFIDRWKECIHKNNGVETIRIDCFKSEAEYIKNNILKSELNNLFDFNNISFEDANMFACGVNLVKYYCDIWNNREEIDSATTITQKHKIDRVTLLRYLKIGMDYGWCEYDADEESRKGRSKAGINNGFPVSVFDNDTFLGNFYSMSELARKSKELFGVDFTYGGISKAVRENRNYKGYRIEKINEEVA